MDRDREVQERLKPLKARVRQEAEALLPRLKTLAEEIHGFTELKFEERKSAALLVKTLAGLGFEVAPGTGGLETAFFAQAGGLARPAVAFLAEYDALPGVGHGCGHNLIAAASVGAGAALLPLMAEGRLMGSAVVIGTPGEEGGGGKVFLVREGVFAGLDAALMIHPAAVTIPDAGSLARVNFSVEFFGRAAHAASAPHRGVNALDALIQTFVGISALRQQLPEDVRLHGIITHGGEAVNIIPEYSRGVFGARAASMTKVMRVYGRVKDCVQGAALAAGCTYKIAEDVPYKEMRPNPVLNDLLIANFRALGRTIDPLPVRGGLGSTDLGDVSHVLPSVSPYLRLDGPDPSVPLVWHTRAVHEAAVGPSAVKWIEDGAKALAMTAVDLLGDPACLEAARKSFHAEASD
jgi:amidohydrolase